MSDEIHMKREDVIHALKQLEIIVPSLDRLGSASTTMTQEEFGRATVEFLAEWEVFRRLSEVRRILSDQFSDVLGPDGLDELEREFDDLAHWTASSRTPPVGL